MYEHTGKTMSIEPINESNTHLQHHKKFHCSSKVQHSNSKSTKIKLN